MKKFQTISNKNGICFKHIPKNKQVNVKTPTNTKVIVAKYDGDEVYLREVYSTSARIYNQSKDLIEEVDLTSVAIDPNFIKSSIKHIKNNNKIKLKKSSKKYSFEIRKLKKNGTVYKKVEATISSVSLNCAWKTFLSKFPYDEGAEYEICQL